MLDELFSQGGAGGILLVGILAFDFMTQEMAEKVIASNGH